MDDDEVLTILTELKKFYGELKERKVNLLHSSYPVDPDNVSVSTLKTVICNIWRETENVLGAEVRGTKFLSSILSHACDICEGKVKNLDYDNRLTFVKESGLSAAMSDCIDEACHAVSQCTQLRRCLDEQTEMKSLSTARGNDETSEDSNIQSCTQMEIDNDDHVSVVSTESSGEHEQLKLLRQVLQKCNIDEVEYKDTPSVKLAERINNHISELTQKCKDTEIELAEKRHEIDRLKEEQAEIISKSSGEHEQLKLLLRQVLQKCNIDEVEYKDTPSVKLAERINNHISELTQKCNVTKAEVDEKSLEINRLKEECADIVSKLDGKHGELRARLKEVNMLQNEKGDLLNRLSQYTSAQLTHDNPNVADLSDTNRPTKIAEQFSELYDNQWTDAFGVIKDSFCHSEDKTVSGLLFILNQAYEFCLSSAITQDQHIKLALEGKVPSSTTVHENNSSMDLEVSSLEKKLIQDLKKRAIEKSLTVVKEDFWKQLKKDSCTGIDVDEVHVKAYAQACAHICWHMVLHSPRLYIESSYRSEESFDTNKYKYYKTSGKRYKYIVWPVLYLHQDGPILFKGVAEAE